MKDITGLSINTQKSKIYFSKGCTHKEELKYIIGFPEGFMPTKYLGIPLSENYLKPMHYSSLIDKCRERLEGWSGQTLSFSCRTELLKTVIQGIASYWIHSYKLPPSVCRELDKLCANFLWKGRVHAWRWSAICKPKSERGRGRGRLRSFQDINKVAICKRFWIYCNNETIWASRMKQHYKKHYTISEDSAHLMDSMAWKDLCQVRQVMLEHIYQAPHGLRQWRPHQSGVLSFKSAWKVIRSHSTTFDLANVVWYPNHCPKISTCLLRAVQDKLLTRARLKQFGVVEQDTCVLCYSTTCSSAAPTPHTFGLYAS